MKKTIKEIRNYIEILINGKYLLNVKEELRNKKDIKHTKNNMADVV